MVFIQFAGFTFGKSASAYATPWHGFPGNNNSSLLGGHDTVTFTSIDSSYVGSLKYQGSDQVDIGGNVQLKGEVRRSHNFASEWLRSNSRICAATHGEC